MSKARHARPSKAGRAARAAGAAAVPGVTAVLLAVPAQAATMSQSAVPGVSDIYASHIPSRVTARSSEKYTVQPGDTLSSIAQSRCGSTDWNGIYQQNRSVISNPDLIYSGERLVLDCSEHATLTAAVHRDSITGGTLDCSGLENLWESAGGSHTEAFMAAEIAEAESGGNQYALSPTDDYGYWQINASHGPGMATFNAMGNARAAVAISDDGQDWDPWTTYTMGLFEGKC
jgi:Lysozyme like domain/LysM domain